MFLRKKQIQVLLMILISFAAFLFVACDGGEASEEGGGGGLADGYPLGTAEVPPLTPEDQVVPGTEEIIEPDVTATAEITETEEMTETATVEITGTVEVTAEPTEEMESTEEAPSTDEETFVVLASELIGMSIQDSQENSATELGTVAEVLVDDTGAIQYVVVDVGSASAMETTESATPEATATGEDTETTELMSMNTVAVPWDSFAVEPDTAAQGPALIGTPETSTTNDNDANDNDANENDANENDANENDANENDANENENAANENEASEADEKTSTVSLVYTGDTSLEAQPAFDSQILDEQGFILDEEGAETDETAVPTEYTDLLQVSEYRTFELQNATDDDLGLSTDLLINLTEGQVVYLVVEVEDRLVPVPWSTLQVEVTFEDETEDEAVMLETTVDVVAEAPDIELSDWDPEVEQDWDADIRSYWESNMSG